MSRAPFVVREARQGVPARQPDRLRHASRLALPESEAGGDVPARVDGRDGRERRRALRTSRARSRTRSRSQSQRRWAAAAEAGRFDDELVPVGDVTRDEHPRPDTSLEKLARAEAGVPRRAARSRPATPPGINDGAAALVIASEEKARELGIEPLGAFVGSAVAGVDPRVMGIGPVPAVRKLLERTGVDGRRPRPRRAERGVRRRRASP